MTRTTGKKIAKDAGLDLKHALYRRSGDWYHILRDFPSALIDKDGLMLFSSKEEYLSFIGPDNAVGASENSRTNTLTVKHGIVSHPDYIRFDEIGAVPEETFSRDEVFEGATVQLTVNGYKRDLSAKKLCVKEWGVRCRACDFVFEEKYGEIGRGFIHVHHLTPLASIKAEYRLNPVTGLRPVCPNCHAMLHRRQPPYSIEELREIIKKSTNWKTGSQSPA